VPARPRKVPFCKKKMPRASSARITGERHLSLRRPRCTGHRQRQGEVLLPTANKETAILLRHLDRQQPMYWKRALHSTAPYGGLSLDQER